jgi:hypothetical protein
MVPRMPEMLFINAIMPFKFSYGGKDNKQCLK